MSVHVLKTSSPRSPSSPSAPAQSGIGAAQARHQGPPRSSSPFSSSSTADGGESTSSSPVIPALPAPELPARALEILRTTTPIGEDSDHDNRTDRYVTASWGSPYPQSDGTHLRQQSFSSSDLSEEESPLHHLEIATPFLRPAPSISPSEPEHYQPSLSGSAAILANRARRPVRGLTEDWIRQHTTNDLASEHRHWLSDGTDESEHSSLSDSASGDEAAWFEEVDPRTPRASARPVSASNQRVPRRPRARSSNETLKQALINNAKMDGFGVGRASHDALSIRSTGSPFEAGTQSSVETDRKSPNGSLQAPPFETPKTPPKPTKALPAHTPRLKKKVPWRGKNIMVLLPRDEERGQPGKAPIPLGEASVTRMLESWEELGYNIRGFDLDGGRPISDSLDYNSQSRNLWPDLDDMVRERAQQKYKVTLPDLNAWKDYVNELNEAKLRALGVSFGDEEPAPPPSISPAGTNPSRQNSNQYPPLPFSPPIPTSSAGSNVPQGFPFPAPFLNGTSAAQSPGIPSVASPASFNPPSFHQKFNNRASISISPHELPFLPPGQPSPHGWSPQMYLQQQLGRTSSPSIHNINGLVSSGLPFQRDGMSPAGMHSRHQSLQYPMLPHQQLHRHDSARASPRLQELREVDEEIQSNPYEKSPSPPPEPTHFVRHNASESLQKEIDDAEYHLEEQFRSQLEQPDYNPPHHDSEQLEVRQPMEPAENPEAAHARGPSVHFGNFGTDSDEGPKLHHPQPHSRGHSLSQKPFFDHDESRDSGNENKFRPQDLNLARLDESYEIETNPSNTGTPLQSFDLVNQMHQRTMSTVSNPWANEPSADSKGTSRRPSHGSKPSLSKLNAAATEFKFNPTNNFTPGQFVFGNNAPAQNGFQQPPFQSQSFTSNPPQSAASSHFSMHSTSSSKGKINPSAPLFSPAKSTFSFSASGPKFNPDAPSFQPKSSLVSSVASPPASGSEAGARRTGSIFGNINLNVSEAPKPEIVKPAKKSKAIPILRPTSQQSPTPTPTSEQNGQTNDDSRAKKQFREKNEDDDEVPLFAEPTPEPDRATEQDKSLEEEDTMHGADNTHESTVLSESTDGKVHSESNDTKATTSPSATSPDQDHVNWQPFEFRNQAEMQSFNDARPFGEDEPTVRKEHKKSLSASAQPFVPTGFLFGAQNAAPIPFKPSLEPEPTPMVEPDMEDDRAGSPTPGPELRQASEPRVEVRSTPEEGTTPPPQPVEAPPPRGLGSSRYASPPISKGLGASRFAATPSPQPKAAGLGASRFAADTPSTTVSEPPSSPTPASDLPASQELHSFKPLPASPPSAASEEPEERPTFEEIDAVMEHLHKKDPTKGVKRIVDPARDIPSVTRSPPSLPPAQVSLRSDAPSPSPSSRHQNLSREKSPAMPSTELEDPFIEPPRSAVSQRFQGPIRRLKAQRDAPESEWDDAFSASEQEKLENRVRYLGANFNGLVDKIMSSRLGSLEDTLMSIQSALGEMTNRTRSRRRDRRSISADIQESDADDEDDETPIRKSMSPRRDRRLEQIRIAVLDALNQQQTSRALETAQMDVPTQEPAKDDTSILKALEDIKEQFGQSLRSELRGEELRKIVEDVVVSRTPSPPQLPFNDDEAVNKLILDMKAKIQDLEKRVRSEEARSENERARVLELEEKLRSEGTRADEELAARRGAEDRFAELQRQLEQAETKVMVEIMNRSVFDQRIHDLEERLSVAENKAETELSGRREAEDRLSEIQRLLRISSEEEDRLRSVVEERDEKIKSIEETSGQTSMRLNIVQGDKANAELALAEYKKRLHNADVEVREARQEAKHWRTEAEVVRETSHRQANDLAQAVNETKHLHKLIDTLGVQLEENERIRDNWRAKFVSLQDDMAHAAREITEENARRTKKEQALIARLEVLDARVQAEARTRERLEVEVERLENGERAGLRAVSECKRLEGILGELRTDNHRLEQDSLRMQRELQHAKDTAAQEQGRIQRELDEARDSAAAEVHRTQISVQSELDAANNQVNVVREELEDEVSKVRAQLDQVRLDADTARAHHEMMLEEAQNSKQTELDELARKHQSEVEDIQTRYERQLNNTAEDAQRTEQNLLERLSLSSSKIEHLQDRVAHLEDKVQIAQEAARAAAQAAAQSKSPNIPMTEAPLQPGPAAQTKQLAQAMQLPEKISPQALRESIMVLQEQLQAREQRIEELEQTVERLDPDAASKISKRDDEITWLRELLAVRHGDLQDIIMALSAQNFDRETVKDAAIRLKANLQMEQQERERAMNGGSALNLPNIAATLKGAATPRVAQAVGPLAAVWGNWRKASQPTLNNISNAMYSPSGARPTRRNATPSKPTSAAATKSGAVAQQQNGFLSGLMTPPASSARASPQPPHPDHHHHHQQQQQHQERERSQPTAFGNTGRRFTAEQFANRARGESMTVTARQAEKMPMPVSTPPQQERGPPTTPPMMRSGTYDADAAQVEDFDDASFFDD